MARLSRLLPKSVITPITTAFFVLVAGTGILLFGHVENHELKGMHVFMGVLFVPGALIHLALNWRSFVSYLRKPATIALGVCTSVLLAFLLIGRDARQAGELSPIEVLRVLETAPLAHVAPLVGMEADQVAEALRRQGFTIANAEQTLHEVARTNKRPVPEILGIVYRSKSPAASG
jgi:hypothetical protein